MPATSSRWRPQGTRTGDTLCDPRSRSSSSDGIPGAGHRMAVEPKTKADQEKMASRWPLAAEDPSFRVSTDQSRPDHPQGHGRTASRHQGRHPARTYKVEANIGAPQVAYRETLTAGRDRLHPQEADRRFGPVRRVKIEFEPGEPGSGFVFENEDRRRRGAEGIHPGVEKGLKSVMENGVLAGFPVVDVKVDADRRRLPRRRLQRLAFEIAARAAFREAEKAARAARADHEGRSGDAGRLHRRRHRRPELAPRPDPGQDMRGNANVINAMVPLANMFGYVNTCAR
jgi:elongation factor G